MAFYYVKSGGTATGDQGRYASEKAANSWATEFTATSQYYNDLTAVSAATTKTADGDFVMISHVTTSSLAGAQQLFWTALNIVVYLFSVDDNDVTALKAGAVIETTANSVSLSDGVFAWGIDCIVDDDLNVSHSLVAAITTTVSGADDNAFDPTQRSIIQECRSILNHATAHMADPSGSTHIFGLTDDVSSVNNTIGMIDTVEFPGYQSMFGIDIRDQVASVDIMKDVISAGVICGVLLPSSWVGNINAGGITAGRNGAVLNYGSGDDDWSYYEFQEGTTIEATKTIYYDDSPFMPDGVTQIAYKIDTDNVVTLIAPVRFAIPVSQLDLSNNKTNTITIKVAYTGTGLTDAELALYVIYPNVTNPNVPKFQATWPTISGSQAIPDPLASGSTLTDTGVETSEWTGLTSGDDTYDLSITIPTANVHELSAWNPIVELWLMKDLGAESLYVSTEVILS